MYHSNLFGEQQSDILKVKLFCDESGTKNWLYIGLLVVPESDEEGLLNDLLNNRCGSKDPKKVKDWINCKEKCDFHDGNNKEVHFTKLNDRKDLYYISERWMNYLLSGNNKIRFYVLGIDRTKLNLSEFGNGKNRESRIYNRFFRAALLYCVKKFFGKETKVDITSIYHDNSSALEGHEYFSWHCLSKIPKQELNIVTSADKIEFLDSDHKTSNNKYSNLIQLIDLITGSIKEVFEAESPKDDNDKIKIATKIVPLVDRIINQPWKKKSRYNYFGRYDISFFPNNTIEELKDDYGDYARVKDNFYKKRPLKISEKNQQTLF
jgi:hypothetical protein